MGGLYCFGLPVFLLHAFINDLLKPAPGYPTNILSIFSWIVAGLMGIYVYLMAQLYQGRWLLNYVEGDDV
jgi:hypothetical protein